MSAPQDGADGASNPSRPTASSSPSTSTAPSGAPARPGPVAPRAVPNPRFRPSATPTPGAGPVAPGRSPTPGAGPAGMPRPTVSMVPGRGAAAGALRAQPRMVFKPVMPQRRKPSEQAAPQIKQEGTPSSFAGVGAGSPSGSGSGSRGGRGGAGGDRGGERGRGGRGGGRGGRREIELVASGPFSMGTGSASRAERSRRMGGSGPTAAAGRWEGGGLSGDNALKPDPGRQSYRDPDKLREREEYSDQEEDVEIVDLDDVGLLDELAPRALPRVQEKDKGKKGKGKDDKKGKGKGKKPKADVADGVEGMDLDGVKADPDAEEAEEQKRLGLKGKGKDRAQTGESLRCGWQGAILRAVH